MRKELFNNWYYLLKLWKYVLINSILRFSKILIEKLVQRKSSGLWSRSGRAGLRQRRVSNKFDACTYT